MCFNLCNQGLLRLSPKYKFCETSYSVWPRTIYLLNILAVIGNVRIPIIAPKGPAAQVYVPISVCIVVLAPLINYIMTLRTKAGF